MMTARERSRMVLNVIKEMGPDYRTAGVEEELVEAQMIAHAEAVREECAKLAESHFIPGHNVAGHRFAAACAIRIRAIEVT